MQTHNQDQLAISEGHTPAPRKLVRHLMEATALAIGGPVRRDADRQDPRLANWLILPRARVQICGTACSRPLLQFEAERVQQLTHLTAIVVRPDPVHHALFDVRSHEDSAWHCAYRLWLDGPAGRPWLVPLEGHARQFSLTATGIQTAPRSPFGTDDISECRGYAHGRLLLSVATEGWF